MFRRVLLGLLILGNAPVAFAQADTITPPRPLFTWRDGLLAGAFAGMAYAAHPLDKHFAQRLQSPTAQENVFLHKTSNVVQLIAVPGSLVIGGSMYAAGRLSKSHRLADLGYHGTEALLVGEALGSVLKGVFGRERPYVHANDPNPNNWQLFRGFGHDDGYRSFPSGHS